MNRRSILKSLGILPIGLFAPKVVKGKETKQELRIGNTIYSCEVYKDFKYFWTGWKHNADSVRLFAQWIALNPDTNIRIYSGSNGTSGQLLKGATFDITTIAPRELIEIDTAEHIKEEHKKLALAKLFEEINKYSYELENPPKEPEYKFGFTGFNNRIFNISA